MNFLKEFAELVLETDMHVVVKKWGNSDAVWYQVTFPVTQDELIKLNGRNIFHGRFYLRESNERAESIFLEKLRNARDVIKQKVETTKNE